jgi:hypothetical protein
MNVQVKEGGSVRAFSGEQDTFASRMKRSKARDVISTGIYEQSGTHQNIVEKRWECPTVLRSSNNLVLFAQGEAHTTPSIAMWPSERTCSSVNMGSAGEDIAAMRVRNRVNVA